ncbi:hypothetical protein CRM22_005852 [Opisthorchis felineus]|uniref:Uncharacterized protein n=1 Tax=Opisthorchis felineus TaxID=147828 RepID=A0A4S2LP56_OPIFE|nr:hypothetical protein CRM22_005852 [Opisthorchis felineus]
MVGSHHTKCSLAPVTALWNDFLSVQCASSEHLKQQDLLSLDTELTSQDRLRWAVEAAVKILIPLDWLAINTAGCIAAYQFLKSLSDLLTPFGDSAEAHSSDVASYQVNF